MGLFDKAFKGKEPATISLTQQEAFGAILIATVGADGYVSDEEAGRVGHAFSSMKLYSQHSSDMLRNMVNKMLNLFNVYGAGAVAGMAAKALPPDLKETAFAMAIDLVLADGEVGEEERKFIEELQGLLQVGDETAMKIVEVMAIKNRA